MPLRYCELTDGSDETPNNFLAGMLRLQHSCNPDFAKQYPRVVKWYVEIDTTTTLVLREIGLDGSGKPVVPGPFGRNDGLWTGVSRSIRVDGPDAPLVAKDDFDAAWKSLEDTLRDTIAPRRIEPRIPVANIEQIGGRWSACILQGPGGMSDQLISFLSSGKGFFEDYNVTLMYYDEFRWEIREPGRITIRGVACYYRDDNRQIVDRSSDFHYPNIAAETQLHHSGSGAVIDVLYLPLRNHRRGWVSDAYGRRAVSVSVSETYRPTFT